MKITDIIEQLKQLGLEDDLYNKFLSTQQRYKKVSEQIKKFNLDVFGSETAPAIYTPKSILNRVSSAGETPNSILNEVITIQDEYSDLYNEYNITPEFINLLNTTKSYLRILFNTTSFYITINDFLNSQTIDYAKRIAEAGLADIKTVVDACLEFIDQFLKYKETIETDPNRPLESMNALYSAVEYLNETLSAYTG